VSHELRTPLTSILALSSLLHDGAEQLDRAKIREMSGNLEGEARRLNLLLSDLLDLERVRMGMLEPRYERVDVTSLVQASVERSVRNPRETTLRLDEIMIDADPAKLERIVDNLVGNADKHTPVSGEITVSTQSMDGGVVISVDDEGLGVPDELKLSVFEPFNRGEADLSEVQGSGIGLSLVAHFAALHGGSAWVEDRPGGGSSFRVFLPGERVAS
jgi:signal transduction histidine kinase